MPSLASFISVARSLLNAAMQVGLLQEAGSDQVFTYSIQDEIARAADPDKARVLEVQTAFVEVALDQNDDTDYVEAEQLDAPGEPDKDTQSDNDDDSDGSGDQYDYDAAAEDAFSEDKTDGSQTSLYGDDSGENANYVDEAIVTDPADAETYEQPSESGGGEGQTTQEANVSDDDQPAQAENVSDNRGAVDASDGTEFQGSDDATDRGSFDLPESLTDLSFYDDDDDDIYRAVSDELTTYERDIYDDDDNDDLDDDDGDDEDELGDNDDEDDDGLDRDGDGDDADRDDDGLDSDPDEQFADDQLNDILDYLDDSGTEANDDDVNGDGFSDADDDLISDDLLPEDIEDTVDWIVSDALAEFASDDDESFYDEDALETGRTL